MIQSSVSLKYLSERAVLKLRAVESKQVVSGFHTRLKWGSAMLTVFLFTADVTLH